MSISPGKTVGGVATEIPGAAQILENNILLPAAIKMES